MKHGLRGIIARGVYRAIFGDYPPLDAKGRGETQYLASLPRNVEDAGESFIVSWNRDGRIAQSKVTWAAEAGHNIKPVREVKTQYTIPAPLVGIAF